MTRPNAGGVALVTGAASRIGAAIARRLAADGFAVVIHHRGGQDQAEALAAEIAASGGRAGLVSADLAVREERRALVARAAALFGPLDVLVNNASSFRPDAVTDLDEALWDRHFAVHVEAPAFLARDLAAQLPAGRPGNIVNIVDERVLNLAPAYFSYTLSKAALWTMTQTLAQSLAPHIRVNAIGPGPTLRHEGQSEAQFAAAVAATPLGRAASPEDIAAACAFILAAPAMTGQMLALDGGKHIDYIKTRGITPRQP